MIEVSVIVALVSATVPTSVVTFMKLKEGDFIDWDLQVINGKMTLIVSKAINKK
jgi:hypothetical protein